METEVREAATEPDSCTALDGSCKIPPVSAATSRATPSSPRQSGRLGVKLSSKTTSLRPMASTICVPEGREESRVRIPLASSAMPSSLAEQSMPWENTPRISWDSTLFPPASWVPGPQPLPQPPPLSGHGLHFQPRHGKDLRQFFGGTVEINVFLEPLHADFHKSLRSIDLCAGTGSSR